MGDSERALAVDGEVRMKQTLKDERDGNNLFLKKKTFSLYECFCLDICLFTMYVPGAYERWKTPLETL